MKSVDSWNKRKRSLYVISEDKQQAEKYVNSTKSPKWEISKTICLGVELSARMFADLKEKK